MGFLWGILACVIIGAIAWRYGLTKGKNDTEVRAVSLLSKISELIREEDPENAQQIIRRYTSVEAKIRDILIFDNLD